MKAKRMSKAMSSFSAAMQQPIMFLAIIGLILSVSVILKLNFMPDAIKTIGGFFYDLMMNAGLNQLSLILCVGLTVGFAKKKKGEATVVGLLSFLMYLYSNHAILALTGRLVEAPTLIGTGQAMVLGVQVTDMGVMLGMILGCITGYIFNRFCDAEAPDVLRMYGGTRFVVLIMVPIVIVLAAAFSYVWPMVNMGIAMLGGLINSSGLFGVFLYGFLNKVLIPTGLHHIVYMSFLFTPLGGALEVGGNMYYGAQAILSAQMGNLGAITALDPSVKYLQFGFAKVFGTIGIVMAFVKTAKPSRKAAIRSSLIPSGLVAVLSGVTEPLDFAWLFVSPVLWFVHAGLDGLFQMLNFAFGSRLTNAGGLIPMLPSLALPWNLTKPYVTLLLGVVGIFTWYFVFTFLIQKLNLMTPGREPDPDDTAAEDMKLVEAKGGKAPNVNKVAELADGLGGAANIKRVVNCMTRLRIELVDASRIDEAKIALIEHHGLVKNENDLQIIIGPKVQTLRDGLAKHLGME